MSSNLKLEVEIEKEEVEALGSLVLVEEIPTQKQLTTSKEELCKLYNEYKGFIPVILSIVKKIPYGSKIATVIETLQQIADFACAI